MTAEDKTSMEEAGGVAAGLVGHIHGYNADVCARMGRALVVTGKWVEKESGCLLGHIKCALYHDDGTGVTLNLTDLDNGIEQHGTMEPCDMVNFNFMAAVLDVDGHELEHIMMHALEDTGIDYHLENGHHHHHEHGEECHCHDHDHDEHHHHEHGEECHCHDHDHDEHHHHEHGEECHCHDHDHVDHDKDKEHKCCCHHHDKQA